MCLYYIEHTYAWEVAQFKYRCNLGWDDGAGVSAGGADHRVRQHYRYRRPPRRGHFPVGPTALSVASNARLRACAQLTTKTTKSTKKYRGEGTGTRGEGTRELEISYCIYYCV
jgi:hypothetical protein